MAENYSVNNDNNNIINYTIDSGHRHTKPVRYDNLTVDYIITLAINHLIREKLENSKHPRV